MTEEQRQIQNQEREQKRQRQKARAKKRKIATAATIAAAFVLGLALGRLSSYIDLSAMKKITVLADGVEQNNKTGENILDTEQQQDNEIALAEDNFNEIKKSAPEEEVYEEETEEVMDIPDVIVQKPVDYSLKQAVEQLEQMAATDERYEAILSDTDKYPEKLLINLANNPEMISFVANYEGNTTDDSKAILTEEELEQEFPLFLQWDERWGYLSYGDDSNIAISGCGPTTLSMAVVALTGDKTATPAAIAEFAMSEGYYLYGTGTKWSLMTNGAKAYGLTSKQINISQSEIKRHLDEGDVIVCSVKRGDFTTGGHFILIYGYDEDGLYINDPFCVYRSNQKWNYSEIRSQIKAVWALGV